MPQGRARSVALGPGAALFHLAGRRGLPHKRAKNLSSSNRVLFATVYVVIVYRDMAGMKAILPLISISPDGTIYKGIHKLVWRSTTINDICAEGSAECYFCYYRRKEADQLSPHERCTWSPPARARMLDAERQLPGFSLVRHGREKRKAHHKLVLISVLAPSKS